MRVACQPLRHRDGGAGPGRTRTRGTSLLEMLLVIALIAMAGVLAAAALNGGIDGMRLRTAGKAIASQLRYTRTQAIATGTPQRFLIDPQQRRWEAPGGHHGDLPSSLEVRFTGARQVQSRQDQGAIQFFPDGASTGGRIDLRVKDAIWRVDVGWITGEVRSGQVRTPTP
ncbi:MULTISPECIES: GspH/FimT family pseudopilin [unclassified Xanthomonas]|uniref:type II secretion system protein XpsH n=1 Tax=unclassified Xanthomonas TaxID=2643310 RepID=UPI00160833C8|nr:MULTISPECIES: GspH/FimT family pseudopilin [unclassified Xanthomonas]MBB4130900.1 general secretion pathway protein H [Xanthomonas sp. 3075]MBB5864350.1 general secretion pathway protein H [Xanthomonas sp. 3058]